MQIVLSFFNILLQLAIVLVVVWTGVSFYVCRQYTKTWNGFRFMCDRKYWALSVFNYWYTASKENGETVDDFIVNFTKHFLMPHQKGMLSRMRESERKLLVSILSHDDFFTARFGHIPFCISDYKDACSAWDEYFMHNSYGGQN